MRKLTLLLILVGVVGLALGAVAGPEPEVRDVEGTILEVDLAEKRLNIGDGEEGQWYPVDETRVPRWAEEFVVGDVVRATCTFDGDVGYVITAIYKVRGKDE